MPVPDDQPIDGGEPTEQPVENASMMQFAIGQQNGVVLNIEIEPTELMLAVGHKEQIKAKIPEGVEALPRLMPPAIRMLRRSALTAL